LEKSTIRAVITGVTGMVGEGVLHECLLHPDVEQVLVISRKPCGISHPKLKEIIHGNFLDFSSIEDQLISYNACFFCLGVSSVGMKEEKYHQLTYELTMHVAKTLIRLNPEMVICYVTGHGTDQTERGRSMWARVKGKTENHLLQLPFKAAYMFRPAYIHPTKGLKNTLRAYTLIAWLYPVWQFLIPKYVCSLKEVGLAMINVVNNDYHTSILEPKDIITIAKLTS
jgi:hypothetical protein